MSRPEAARDLPEHSSLIITVLDLRGPSGMLPAPALLRDNRTTSLVLLPRLRAPGRGSDKSVPYAISNRLAAPPPTPKDSASEGSLERNLPYATQVVPGDVSLTRQPWALHQPFSHGLDSPRAVATTAAQAQRRHSMRRYRGKRMRPAALETTVTLKLSLGGARPPARPPSG